MILKPGTKVLVAHRRLFETDHGRYFTGVVDAYEAGMIRVTGHTWLRDGYRGSYTRKDDERTKVLSGVSGGIIVYQLSSDIDLASLEIVTEGIRVLMRDNSGFEMDLSEGVIQNGEGPATVRRGA